MHWSIEITSGSVSSGDTLETDYKKSDYTDSATKGSTDIVKRPPPEYVAGPVNGHLYAQVDKAFKKKVRSMSLDSGARSRGGDNLNFFENRANTLNRRNAYGFKNKESADCGLNKPNLHYTNRKMEQAGGDGVNSEVKSIEKLLQELGECSELLDSTLQQAPPGTSSVESHTFRVPNGGPISTNGTVTPLTPPGPPVRQKASFDAGVRYYRREIPLENGISATRQGQGTPSRSPTVPSQYSQNGSWNGNLRTGQMSNGLSVGETPLLVLHEAPLSQTSPPLSPLSPKFYATQMMPRTFKATTVNHTTVGYNSSPHDGTNGLLTVANEWTSPNSGKLRGGPVTYDFNNNKSANNVDLFDLDGRKTIEDSETLPEKGNVRSKIALLTDMFQPDRVRPPPHQHVKGHLVPMPGLTGVSPTEVSNEIANYNAKSLAPGELSHSSGTLYTSGAPPKRIVEKTKHAAEPTTKVFDFSGESHKPPAHEYLVHKTDFTEQHLIDKSPPSSIDGNSLDEGVESKGSIDEPTNLGISPSASSDGHTDSAFGESIVSSSSVSTPVGGLSSNRFNPTLSAATSHDEEPGNDLVSQQSSSSNLQESTPVHVQEAQEDEEAGYARLEDIRSAKEPREKASPESGGPTETRTTLDRTSPIGTPRVEGIVEQIQAKTSTDDVEAIKDILLEISDISASVPQPAELSRSSTPQSFKSAGVDSSYRSPVLSEGSGTFENATQRKKSHPHSDKGYGSTTSVSSGSSGDNVFLPDSPKIPGLKFDRDTSSFWYKPSITRNDANDILKDSEPGSFIIRDSQSFPGAFGLAVKVAVPPAHVLQGLQGDLTKVDLDNELVRHFLIETTKKGVRLKGYNDEPVFGSLAAFVYQHSITPLALPIRLTMPSHDLLSEDKDQTTKEDGQSWPQGAVGSLMYLGRCEVEMLTGPSAIQRTVEQLSTDDAAKKFTTVSFKVTPQGMTVTDNERKVFFRQHFHMKSILYCGIDPSDKRWDLKTPTYSGKSKSFGLVLRQTGGVHNECHLFGEISKDWPSSILVNILNRSMTSST